MKMEKITGRKVDIDDYRSVSIYSGEDNKYLIEFTRKALDSDKQLEIMNNVVVEDGITTTSIVLSHEALEALMCAFESLDCQSTMTYTLDVKGLDVGESWMVRSERIEL